MTKVNGVSKIIKYLEELGYKVELYVKNARYTRRGMIFSIDIYIVDIKEQRYFLYVKTSGKAEYVLSETNSYLDLAKTDLIFARSQSKFIEEIKKEIVDDKYAWFCLKCGEEVVLTIESVVIKSYEMDKNGNPLNQIGEIGELSSNHYPSCPNNCDFEARTGYHNVENIAEWKKIED